MQRCVKRLIVGQNTLYSCTKGLYNISIGIIVKEWFRSFKTKNQKVFFLS